MRRGLQPYLEGHVLADVKLNRPDLRFPFPDRMVERLRGARIERLNRRAKYLVAETDRAERLIIHLGMSGRFTILDPAETRPNAPGQFVQAQPTLPQHDHVEFLTETGARIVFNDPRRFGYMQMFAESDADPFEALGPEPLSNAFNAEYLTAALVGKKTPIKSALLDQSVIAGLGNIYVCEALFDAGISPRRLASNVGRQRCERLVPAIRGVLQRAIEAGGSTLKDYAHADGGLGYFQHSFKVYGREGHACPKCSSQVQRQVQSGRSSFFCSVCQR